MTRYFSVKPYESEAQRHRDLAEAARSIGLETVARYHDLHSHEAVRPIEDTERAE